MVANKITDISVELGNLKLKNPVMNASGTFGYGLELVSFSPPEALGAVITKGLSLKPRAGNPSPRIFETPSGLINSIGLQNIGVDAFIKKALPFLLKRKATVVANILGDSAEEYALLSKRLSEAGVHLIEVNVSCPNVAQGGLSFGANPKATYEVVVAAVEAACDTPVMVKLSPLVSDITKVALAAEQAGATAVSLINTLPAMAVNLETQKPEIANLIGGLSGPAIKAVALRQVYLCAQALKIPVVGLGGISTAKDALEFILVGAQAVQVGTAIFSNPKKPLEIIEGIEKWCSKKGLKNIAELRGSLKFKN